MSETADTRAGECFAELVGLMTRLRGPEGCPWDRKQTFASIKPYTLEETYEVLDAIDNEDWPNLCEELGDFLLQAVFYAEMARERGLFDIADALGAINRKLVRRHPHVFGEAQAATADDVKQHWDRIKQDENSRKGINQSSILHGISRSQPALAEAQQIGQKSAAFGFDWPDVQGVLSKVQEEVHEVRQAATAEERESEVGDLLFTIVNLARWCGVDAEGALRKANGRFRARFSYVERGIAGQKDSQMPRLEAMEALWVEAKKTL